MVGGFDLDGGDVVEVGAEAGVVEPPDPSARGDLEVIEPLHGPPLVARAAGLRRSPVLNMPLVVSAMALSKLSPTLPIDVVRRVRTCFRPAHGLTPSVTFSG